MINKSMHFGDKTKIYNKLYNIFNIYLIVYTIVMFIAGGDGIYFGMFSLAMLLLPLFINFFLSIIFNSYNSQTSQINQIIVSDNSIIFKLSSNKAVGFISKTKTEEYDLDGLKIEATVSAMICEEKNVTLPNAFIVLSLTQKDGSVQRITDGCNDIDHSLKLLEFLKKLDCFSYKLEADTFEHPTASIQLENAIGDYLKNNIYDKKAFKYYSRRFYLCIGILCSLFMLSFFILILTVFGLEMVFHIAL